MRLRTWLAVAVTVLAMLLLVGRAASSLVVDHAWFSALGVPGLFWERFSDTVLLQGTAWILGSAFAFANLHAVRRTILAVAVPSRVANIELTAMIPARRLLSITLLAAAMIGLALALPFTDWSAVAMARHGISFGEIEGILDRDLGFYVYLLPLEEMAYMFALAALVVVITVVTLLYALTRSLRLDGRRVIASNHVRRHLSALGALVLLLLAWSYRLDMFDLLQRGTGPDGLFLRADHVVSLQADRALVILCAIAAPVLLRAGWTGQVRAAFITLSVVLAAAIGGRQLLPILLARGGTLGDPARRDVPYVATRTLVSRRAFDVDAIRAVPADDAITARASLRTRLSLAELPNAVSLWEPQAARIRGADARGVAVDAGVPGWLRAPDGRLAALLVRRPAAGNERWSASVVDVTQPVLRDSVLDFAVGDRRNDAYDIVEPLAAPGLQGHRLVSDPAGVQGPALRGLGMRVAYAWATRDPSLLDADTISGPAARIVSYRDVHERLRRLVPVLVQSDDVHPILDDGSILWAVNLYSSSSHFPLSQRWDIAGDERSYFRFAATALVDAATGRVRLVPVERPDPVARTWLARVPALVVPIGDLPPRVVDQLPPPTESAMAQVRTFARYGSRMEGAVPRHFPDSVMSGALPRHLVGASGALPAWSVPLLDAREQLDGVVTVVGGRDRGVYWDSTRVPRPRWDALTERLHAALDTARAGVPEGSRREPRVRIGAVQVVPGEQGPILMQSLIWNRADGAPLISRVAVLQEDRLGIGHSLADAIAAWRGLPPSERPAMEWPLQSGAARDERVSRLYEEMRDAMRRGDWVRFGAAFDSLGLVVGRPPR